MKVSFDFDSTLSEGWVQKLAEMFIAMDHEVFVTTTRRDIDCSEVFEVADRVGIPRENCTFTHYEDKQEFVKSFDIHFDDDRYEIDLINRKTKCKGILVGFKDYSTAKIID